MDTVRALLDTGVKVDVKGQYLGTPLHWASRGTKAGADMVRLLLSHGAAIESLDSHNNTQLLLAAYVSFNFSKHENFHICSCYQELYYHLSSIFHMCVVYHN